MEVLKRNHYLMRMLSRYFNKNLETISILGTLATKFFSLKLPKTLLHTIILFQSCRFDLKQFAKAGCSKSNDYGFAEGKPCVILTLNRLIGWKPIDYAPDSVPEAVKGRYQKNFVTFSCDGTVCRFYCDRKGMTIFFVVSVHY